MIINTYNNQTYLIQFCTSKCIKINKILSDLLYCLPYYHCDTFTVSITKSLFQNQDILLDNLAVNI